MGKRLLLVRDRIKTVKIHAVRLAIRSLYIFPIKRNRVVFFSYYGKQYSCNPKVISEYLEEEYRGNYEIIWTFLEPEKFHFLIDRGIKTVKYKSFKRLYLQATAKYTINNCGAFSWMPLRKGQYHINTWHAGGAYKHLTTGTAYNRLLTAKETTHMISGCEAFTKYNIEECFDYYGKVLEIGMPRNDIFFNKKKMNEKAKTVREEYGISAEDYVVLYAPTWRYDGKIPYPDFALLKKTIEKKYGRNAVIIGRGHSLSKNMNFGTIDASDYPDMQDLLCAADMLITDYSSSIWDYSFTYRPCILYVEDIEKYTREQGFLIDIHEWGFPICQNNSALKKCIEEFDDKEFVDKMKYHQKWFGSYEKGNATEKFCKEIFDLETK